jgi:uncharacterized damage-inducible protein DinB
MDEQETFGRRLRRLRKRHDLLAGLMVQVLNHSTEHRTQVSTIITQLGIEPPAMTGWTYLREIGEFHEFGEPAEGA